MTTSQGFGYLGGPAEPCEIIPTAYGKFLAVSTEACRWRIGVIGDTAEEALRLFPKQRDSLARTRVTAMRILACGSRRWDDEQAVRNVLSGFSRRGETEIISGMATGADTYAVAWAIDCRVALHRFPAKWKEHGKAAGPIRNQQMLDEGKPDLVIAFHDDLKSSKGTADMVRRATQAGIPVYLISRPSRGA